METYRVRVRVTGTNVVVVTRACLSCENKGYVCEWWKLIGLGLVLGLGLMLGLVLVPGLEPELMLELG